MDDFDNDHDSNASSDEQDQQDDNMTMEDADGDDMDVEEDDAFNEDDDDQEQEDADQDADAEQEDADQEQEAEQDAEEQEDTTTKVEPPSNPASIASPLATSYLRPKVRPEAITARLYDIVPTMAAPQATSINALAITPDLRYWITGGSDGYIRKYDGPGTINGKQLLTVAQRHPFVDSVTKSGILMSYWENLEPPPPNSRGSASDTDRVLSPVYSLAVHSEALWLLAGLESGGINLHSVRHDEGKTIHVLQEHKNAVSVLQLAPDEKSVLSGSWDKNIFDWDLNTGKTTRDFKGSGGQVSVIEPRPLSGAPIPPEAAEEPTNNSTQPPQSTTQPDADQRPSTAQGDTAPPTTDPPQPLQSPSLVFNSSHAPTQFDPTQMSDSTFLSASIDGTIRLWDRRMPQPLARIGTRPGVPPFCMGACWSPDGNTIYAGRRNGTVEEFSIHRATSAWAPERTLKFPQGSGAVSAVRAMANGRHLVCASYDILRLYDLKDNRAFKHGAVPFLIIPGPPRAGVISQLYVDPTSRFMVTAAGTRGWDGSSTEVLIGYEIGCVND
ncbi:Transcription factor spt8 [Cytospora mali]|uniref:Transcription factor spt8 n=1 Tax=Cytospora mali TaxID=578113 RepID=A0A194W0W0_CYTMA|nr:Transcription factor spt8 [Valsa mali]